MAGTPHTALSLRFGGNGAAADPVAQLDGLERSDVRIVSCADIAQARAAIARYRPIAGLLHFGGRIDEAAREATLALAQAAPRLRLIALVEPASARSAELARLVGKGVIHDFHTLPICRDRLMFSLGHIAGLVALEQAGAHAGAAIADAATEQIVGTSPALSSALQAIRKYAEIDAPALIRGEPGSGKELAAREIHRLSERGKAPFVAFNCAGLPAGIIEAELLGHERGAFAGAIKQKIGRIEAARRGTLFIDEVGDLPLAAQERLLQFLLARKIKRLGASRAIGIDTRILAASRLDLEQAMKAGRFRADLYHQLNILTLDMPPLRERGEDVQLLATYFLRKFSAELKLPKLGFHDGALETLQRYRWPGNVRELTSTVRRAVVMSEGRWLTAADLAFAEAAGGERIALPDLATARKEVEDRLIRDALRMNGGNIKRAAKELGVSRVTFYRLMEKYRIHPDGAHAARVGMARAAMARPLPLRPSLPRPSFRRAGPAAPLRAAKAEDDGRSGELN